MDLSALPESWAAVTLEAVAEVHDNLREPVNSTERKGRAGPFPYYGATGQVGWIDDFRQDGEYVLLGEDGAPFFDPTKDKAYLVYGKCWVNNHAHVLKAREGVCLNRYLLYALNQVNYRGFANGTTRLKLTQAAMRQLPINLAPLAEQHRIVAKIEELFSELDQGVASLKTAREQLKVYRQSLLKNAFEGKLTAAWRAAHADQLETATALQQRIARERQARYQQQLADWEAGGKQGSKPKAPKPLSPLTAEELAELPELPAGWGWVRLETIQAFEKHAVKAGPFGSALKKEFYVAEGFKIYGQEQVIRGDYRYGDYFITESKFVELSSCTVRPFDVLISLVGTIGKVLVLPEHAAPGIINPRLVKISLNRGAYLPAFFKAYFESGFLRSLYATESQGTTMDILNLGMIQGLPYPLCSLEEQQEILFELESKLSEADQLDQSLATALQQADALRQSILKKAFSGQLVKQDKNEEPATALLERIRAARAASPAKGRQAKLVSKSLTNC